MVTETEVSESTDTKSLWRKETLLPIQFYFNLMCKEQIFYTEMTNLLQFTTDVQKFCKHVIFAHELPSVLRLMVGFANIYCDLQQICHLTIKLRLK